MLYVFSKLFWVVVQPGNLLVLLLVLGVAALWIGRGRWSRGVVTTAALAFAALTVLPIGDWTLAPLETRFHRPPVPSRVDGIILLGGAIRMEASAAHGTVELNDQAGRITTTLALARRYPEARVLVSGGIAAIIPRGFAEADLTRSILVEDGLDERRIMIEPRSRNTYENAVFSKELARPKEGQTWLLVTSAFHMPRAVGCFRRAGWDVIPFPTDYHLARRAGVDLLSLDMVGQLQLVTLAVHEWIGLVAYRLLGRTDSLFPGPEISSSSAR